MTSALFTSLTMSLALLSALLLIGTLLRAKIPIFQKLLLPASVLGGFFGLLLGPQVMGSYSLLPFPNEYIATWSLLPGVLILPIFASVPFGNGMGTDATKKPNLKENLPHTLMSCGLFSITGGMQITIGFVFTLFCSKFIPSLNLYRTFGYEMSQGFSGGHGTAGALGGILESFNVDYWATAQGIATTYATIGLVGGMLLGILFINRGTRSGKTQLIQKPSQLPQHILVGYRKDIAEQESLGRETTTSSTIETISVHLAIVLVVCGLSTYLLSLAKQYAIPGLSSIPVWFYGLILMYGVNFLLLKLELDFLFDKKVKARIIGTLSDIAIVAAIASMSVSTVLIYIGPILVLALMGFCSTYFLCFPMYRFFFGKNNYAFERAIMCWGVNTGVTINGMMLLKICDPDYETPALPDFSAGFALMSVVSIFTYPVSYALIATGTTLENLLFSLLVFLVYLTITLIGYFMARKLNPQYYTK